jgi:hypothetical protein
MESSITSVLDISVTHSLLLDEIFDGLIKKEVKREVKFQLNLETDSRALSNTIMGKTL